MASATDAPDFLPQEQNALLRLEVGLHGVPIDW